MIEKILNNYFAKKAVERIERYLIVMAIETRIVKYKDRYVLFIKKAKYKEKWYKDLYSVSIRDGFNGYMEAYKITPKDICEEAERYLKDD